MCAQRLEDDWECFCCRTTVATNASGADAKYEFGCFDQAANEDAALGKGVGLVLYLHHGPLDR